jgi:hypothetical protein
MSSLIWGERRRERYLDRLTASDATLEYAKVYAICLLGARPQAFYLGKAEFTGRQVWTSSLTGSLLPRLRQRTRRCGAQAQITLDGAQTTIWFTLPRKARGIGRVVTAS